MVTMEKTLDEFEQLLEDSLAKQHAVADIVEGTVIKKENDGYLVSVKGAKMEAFLPAKEVSADETLEIGDIKEFYVLKEHEIIFTSINDKSKLKEFDSF